MLISRMNSLVLELHKLRRGATKEGDEWMLKGKSLSCKRRRFVVKVMKSQEDWDVCRSVRDIRQPG